MSEELGCCRECGSTQNWHFAWCSKASASPACYESDICPMDYSNACIELVRLIQDGHFKYVEEAGLALQIFCDAYGNDEDPKMCLEMAKHPDIDA